MLQSLVEGEDFIVAVWESTAWDSGRVQSRRESSRLSVATGGERRGCGARREMKREQRRQSQKRSKRTRLKLQGHTGIRGCGKGSTRAREVLEFGVGAWMRRAEKNQFWVNLEASMFLGMLIDTTGSHSSQVSFGSDTYDHYFTVDCDKSNICTVDHWTQH